jgi:LPPG:FO 2-phospho-L-lactate transferase
MSDAPVRTEVRTDDGWLDFQTYFVGRQQQPTVHEVRFRGAAEAAPTPEVLASFDTLGTTDAIVVAPSNPIVSIGPLMAIVGLRAAIATAHARGVPVIAVSGIVGGRALKGPADRMLVSLGHESSALGVARLYADWIDTFVIDTVDADLAQAIESLGLRVVVTDTIMTDDAARIRLASEVLQASVP